MEITPQDLARATFPDVFTECECSAVAVAPGRVNLIGEHTDYNNGFVLPMAINAHVAVAFSARTDNAVRAHSAVFEDTWEAAIHELTAPGGTEWFDYVAAVAWAMCDAGSHISGMDMVIAGDVPVGAGLASSAALEMAVARAICHVSSIEWDPVHMAAICQRAENRYVGVNCGIMDQFAASVCTAGSAMLLDCRTLEHRAVPIPSEAAFVIMDTGIRRSLVSSEYNDRRVSCEAAVAVLGQYDPAVRSLRDVDTSTLDAAAEMLDGTLHRRASHVVNEIRRPVQMAESLRAGNLDLAGKLMDESHASLRDLYEVSCGELDFMTNIARNHGACFGARMTGAGFGGCAVALVASDRAHEFVSDIADQYSAACAVQSALYICKPSAGAAIV
jgi:galactokinase